MYLKKWGMACLVIASLSLPGCATSPTPLKEAKIIPAERVYFHKVPTDPKPAKIVIVRDTGFSGSGVYQHIYINGERAASLDVGERIDLTMDPGEYLIGVKPTDPFGTHSLYSIDQTLKSEKTYFYRVLVEESARTRIQRYDPARAHVD